MAGPAPYMARIKTAVGVVLTVVFIDFSIQKVEATDGNGTADARWRSLCRISQNLTAFYNQHTTNLGVNVTANNEEIVKEYQLRIYMEMSVSDDAIKAYPIIRSLNKIKIPNDADAKAGVAQVITTTAHFGFLHGHLLEFLKATSTAATSNGDNGCLMSPSSSETLLSSAGVAACKPEVTQLTGDTIPNYDHTAANLFGRAADHATQSSVTHGSNTCTFTTIGGATVVLAAQVGNNQVEFVGDTSNTAEKKMAYPESG
uniref:Variant surface glycoprotein 1125.5728 n=1 Tax=Trypanosoma brucei TaxID=5691 RepID=A0A1J0RDA0_9TRYP|nr:variant surface glycoprotein 1125.5728 [Trypanosoma brucei]